MRELYGPKARLLLCSEKPQLGLTDMLGLGSMLRRPALPSSSSSQELGGGSGSTQAGSGMLEGLLGSGGEGAYAATRCAAEAMMDEVEERAIWAPYRVR